ncbi:MAG: DUF5685 family protein [Eubacteriales bacterium]
MFGYVRPCRPELKCREYDLYRATYCALCKTLRVRYGGLAPMGLSFDMTFLALLLEEDDYIPCKGRCHANLLRKKEMAPPSKALDLAADVSIILTWFQLQDTISDERGFKKLGAKISAALLKKSYRKARQAQPSLCEMVQTQLGALSTLEGENSPKIDAVTHQFATILQSLATHFQDPTRRRATEQLLYHVGRWIYLIDARDDFAEDITQEKYNPLRYRYGETGDDPALEILLENSLNLSRSAFHLLEPNERSGVIENILYLGIPMVQQAVFDGREIQKIWRTKHE